MAEKPKNTPGPWTADMDEMAIMAGGDGGQMIASVLEPSDFVCLDDDEREDFQSECDANAVLLAAAPELADALEMVRDADQDCIRDGLSRWCTDIARQVIDRALAKAGRQPATEVASPSCPDCDGTGRLSSDMQCGKCRGSGEA